MKTTSKPFERWQVVDFYHLHLDTFCINKQPQQEQGHQKQGHFFCAVECKPRPMVICDVEPEEERGCNWYRVLTFTTKGLDQKNQVLPHVIPVGKLLDDQDTYIDKRPQRYPSTMLVDDEGASWRSRFIDRQTHREVIRILEHVLRGAQSSPSRPPS